MHGRAQNYTHAHTHTYRLIVADKVEVLGGTRVLDGRRPVVARWRVHRRGIVEANSGQTWRHDVVIHHGEIDRYEWNCRRRVDVMMYDASCDVAYQCASTQA